MRHARLWHPVLLRCGCALDGNLCRKILHLLFPAELICAVALRSDTALRNRYTMDRFTAPLLCFAMRFISSPTRCFADLLNSVAYRRGSTHFRCHSKHFDAMPLRRKSVRIVAFAEHVAAMPPPSQSLPFTAVANRCGTEHIPCFAVQFTAVQCLCYASRFRAMPLRRRATRSFAFALLCLALPRPCLDKPCCSAPCLCSAFHLHSVPLPCSSMPFLCFANRFRALPLLGKSFLHFAPLRFAFAKLGHSKLCRRTDGRAHYAPALMYLLLPPITLPWSSSSSHRNLPLPLFRHCPMPRSVP